VTTKTKPTQRLTAHPRAEPGAGRRLELYLATRSAEAPLGETRSVRQHGLHLDARRQIEQTIKSAALAELSAAFTVLEKKSARSPSARTRPAGHGSGTPVDPAPDSGQVCWNWSTRLKRGACPKRAPVRCCGSVRAACSTGANPTDRPKTAPAPRPCPTDALTRDEAAAVVSVICSPAHADQSCGELALSLENAPEQAVSVSAVTVSYITGFYAWYNNLHPLTSLGMLTTNQVHSGQAATILAARQTHQTMALTSRRDANHAPFAQEELIAQPLPDVSPCLVYSWAGSNALPLNSRHPLRN